MKTDARVRYTNKVIRDSFIELMKERPLNKITVKSICDLAEINRATFYKYYTDPYDLMEKLKAERFSDLQKLIEKVNSGNITETLKVITDTMKENREIYMILFSDPGDRTFVNQIFSLCYQAKQPNVEDIMPNMPKEQQEWLYYFLANGCSSVLDCWVRGGMKEEPLEVARFIDRLVHYFS